MTTDQEIRRWLGYEPTKTVLMVGTISPKTESGLRASVAEFLNEDGEHVAGVRFIHADND
jgi:hypothetical protein